MFFISFYSNNNSFMDEVDYYLTHVWQCNVSDSNNTIFTFYKSGL